ncbi:MAG TPA: hypothetical protein VJ875_14210 [Pyrinomonadaceae bacterium]|nr:hypothetical protein [Pyrinomonadaceae bacterium]
MSACQRSRVEPSTVSAPAPADSASNKTVLKPGPQPTDAELREAVKRNYQDAVTIDDSQPVPFLVGDFNGDRSEDIAIAVKPGRGKVSELNSEYVNWILEDPAQFPIPGHKNQRVTVGNNDLLLAVIHGEGREGWRSSLARQTYLLKNAVGANLSDGAIRWTGGRYLSHPGK